MLPSILLMSLVILAEHGSHIEGKATFPKRDPIDYRGHDTAGEKGTDVPPDHLGYNKRGENETGVPYLSPFTDFSSHCKKVAGVILSALRFNESGLLLSYSEFCINLDSKGAPLPIPPAYLGSDGTPMYPDCNETEHVWTNPDLAINLPVWMGKVATKMNAKHGSGCVHMVYRYSTGILNHTLEHPDDINFIDDPSIQWGHIMSIK